MYVPTRLVQSVRLLRTWRTPYVFCATAAACAVLVMVASADVGRIARARISGGERIAWEQVPVASEHISAYRFLLYIDGRQDHLPDVTCAAGSPYTCSAVLPVLSPGPHALEMSAVAGGLESERSAPLLVFVEAPVMSLPGAELLQDHGRAPGEPEAPAPPESSRLPSLLCADSLACYDVEPLVRLDGPITLVVPVGDGRVLFVENGHHIRVLAGTTLLPESALTVERGTDRIIAVALDRAFSDTGAVFVAWIERPAPGRRELVVARYRELQNRLAQRAVVVSLPFTADGDPHVALDAENQIYVALPAGADSRLRGPDPYGGSVLRFAPDGTVPSPSGQTSPILASAFERPSAMTSDAAGRRVWIAGRDGGSAPAAGWVAWAGVPPRAAGRAGRSLIPEMGLTGFSAAGAPGADIVSLAVSSDGGEAVRVFTVDAEGHVHQVLLGRQPARVTRLTAGDANVRAVVAGPRRTLYVVTEEDAFALQRLTPRLRN
jgi:hypothetical protein